MSTVVFACRPTVQCSLVDFLFLARIGYFCSIFVRLYSRASVGAVLDRFGKADLRVGCCPGYQASRLIFVRS